MLERLDFGTENEALRIAHALDGGQHVFADALVLSAQVQERNGEGNGPGRGVSERWETGFHGIKILAGAVAKS